MMMFKEYKMILLGVFILLIGILISVAYLTLLERKILSYIQFRKGPNKVGMIGIFQPLADAVKLFMKEYNFLKFSNYLMYYISPILSLMLSLMLWLMMPYYFNMVSFKLGMLYFFCLISLGVYMLLMMGWSSNSNYSLLGALRAVAQTISYEVSLSLIMVSSIFFIMDFNLLSFKEYQILMWFVILMFPLGLMWLSSSMAETNRSPYDFSEGESELVSGFNIEYSSGGFALIFMSEYSSIIFMSMLFVVIYMGGYDLNLMFYLKLMFISFLFLWVRGTLPRYRYDKLMYLAWKSYLPLSLNFLMFFLGLKILMN